MSLRKRFCPPDAVTAIFVEGGDEERILQLLAPVERVFVLCFDGREPDRLRERTLAAANDPAWPRIGRVGVILDAEQDVPTSWSLLCGVFGHLGLRAPTEPGAVQDVDGARVGGFLLPDNAAPGSSETLMLRAATPEQLRCIEAFFVCTPNPGTTVARRDKARAHALAAATVDGGRPDALWRQQDPVHPAFGDLRRFLNDLLA